MRETIIASSVLILCIALLRKLCRGRISACLQYALWLIVAVRLIVPGIAVVFPDILPKSDLSIMNVADRVAAAAQSGEPENYDMTLGGLPFLSAETESKSIADFFASGGMSAWADIFKIIWYLGIVAVGAWMFTVNIIFMRNLRKSRIRYEKEEFELPVTIPVYLAKDLPSPCLYGMLGNQAIYLPEDVIDDENRVKHILTHEYCHYKHRDIFWSALRCVIVAVYWFNPLVWVAAVMSKQDCELACDESAIRMLGDEERVAYGKTLVSLIMRKTKASDIVCAATTMTGGIEGVKERVRRIADKPHRLMIALIPVVVTVCAAAVFTFTQAKEYPNGAQVLEGESTLTVTTDCFQVTFPEYFSDKAYYCGENNTDIIVYHKDSDREIGRFCKIPYEEAVKLADEKEVVLIGSYGANNKLNNYIKGYGMLGHEDSFSVNGTIVHEYYPAEEGQDTPAGEGGVPGTDSNDDDTTYILSENLGGMQEIPAPEEVDKEVINLPYENVAHEDDYLPEERIIPNDTEAGNTVEQHTYTPNETSTDYAPNEINETGADYMPNEVNETGTDYVPNEVNETNTDYLPDESVTTIAIAPAQAISGMSCYLYVPADNSDAKQNFQPELSEMNRKLEELTGYVSVLSVSVESMQEILDTVMENRTPYVGDSTKTSTIADTILTTEALDYQYLSMDTGSEPYAVTLYYQLYGDYGIADSDMQFMGAVLMFASIENLKQCNIQIKDINNPVLEEAYTEYQYSREEMEKLFGVLYPCSETKEDFVDLYNRVLEYLENQKN